MPKAITRKAGPQTARSAPYPTPTAPPTSSQSNITSNETNEDNGPLSARPPNIPSKKAATTKPTTTKPTTATTTAAPAAPSGPPQPSSFLDLTLPKEAADSVPVYDSCAQIRTKIKNLLEKKKKTTTTGEAAPAEKGKTRPKDGTAKPKPWTAKAFCEAVGVSASSYQNFMKKTGHMGGAENRTFYGAYVFFEKKRLFEGAKKSAARVKMEEEWPRGLELQDPKSISIWVKKGENPRDFIPKLYGGTQPASIWSKR